MLPSSSPCFSLRLFLTLLHSAHASWGSTEYVTCNGGATGMFQTMVRCWMLLSGWQLVHSASSHCRLVWLISRGPKQQSKVRWNQALTTDVRSSGPWLPNSGKQVKSFGSERRYSGLPLTQVSQPLQTLFWGSSRRANAFFESICGGGAKAMFA